MLICVRVYRCIMLNSMAISLVDIFAIDEVR